MANEQAQESDDHHGKPRRFGGDKRSIRSVLFLDAALDGLAREVNMVWNYLNELSSRAIRERRQFMSGYDLQKYVAGATKEGLGIPSQTLQQICEEYPTRRKQLTKSQLRWRVSNPKSPKRSLGWLPFKKGAVVWRNGQIRYAGKLLSLWNSADVEPTLGSSCAPPQAHRPGACHRARC